MLISLRFIYTLCIILIMPLFFLRLLWKSMQLPAYRSRMLERLGICPSFTVAPGGFLIQAVSLGEVNLALPLVKALQTQYPNLSITITSTTPTGSHRVQQALANKVAHMYLPYDLPWTMESLYNKVKPSCVIIMETEIWPHLINMGKKHNIPVVIVNGRISDQSLPRYLWIRFFVAQVLKEVTFVAAQSAVDGNRFLQLGLPTNKLQISGNLKFDAQVNEQQQQIGRQLKGALADRLIWVAASTHPGEEEQVLDAFQQVQAKFPNCLLILIPRHPDRFNEVAELLASRQINFIRRTENKECASDVAVILGDTMGEMTIYYAMADLAYVGGSLVPIGGHNLLEPSALGVPSITGRHYMNFKEIVTLLQNANALSIAQNADELAAQVITLFAEPALRVQRGANALQVCLQNRGALDNMLKLINCYRPVDTYPSAAVAAKC